ncbi:MULTISPECIES: ABC transporter substrate-binding protein [unclassified Paenibacillus]|uniref:ABC transporter substrate-binding protein n=1 Tax=unclassified Paenibacillus TaxID=185978 RepID=UPI0009554F6C|nr:MULTISPECIES: ABC transporter substrate-binding protein [unclassified Paenibacillus]ASS68464.1 ABC transporter substrate-binding protein [Paenibacillus sp. RUD330]SIR34458.1 putative ABC transport system substrate-binding protein [Paenibacillus sp. RU4X]SIR45196.1 putative ABC transport system substrate-binding protein [Paenibacillus sp. RU4T]
MGRKRMWASALLAVALMTAAGCGAKNTNEGGSASPAPSAGGAAEGKTYSIAISQIVEHPSLDATREGFLAALKDAGIVEGDNLKVDFNNAQGDQSNNLSIAQKIASGKNDLVLAIATPSAQAVAEKVKNAPILFAAVTDPLDAKLVTSLDKPGGNISGASDTNPDAIVQLMDFIASDFPNVKSVGLVINEGESNAVIMAKNAEQALAKHDIKLVKAPVSNTSEVKQAAESLVGRADALFTTLDNTVISGVDTIIQVANAKKLPFFSSDRDTVEKGAFATVGFKYYDHGYQVGQMAAEVLKDGKKVGDMKVSMQEKLDLILNLKAAEAQGIAVTDDMKAKVKDQASNIIQ